MLLENLSRYFSVVRIPELTTMANTVKKRRKK